MVKVFIIDKHPVMRQGLASVLGSGAGFQVLGEASSAQEALSQIDELKPDVVIMDVCSGNNDDFKDIEMIQEKCVKAKVLLLTDSTRENDFIKAIGTGVRGYLLKDSEVSQLVDAIRLVSADGAVVYSSKIARQFDSIPREASQPNQLSQREIEIINLVARGHSNKDIANLCFVSDATVKAHIRRIMEKLDAKNRAEAVTVAIEKGLIGITSMAQL